MREHSIDGAALFSRQLIYALCLLGRDKKGRSLCAATVSSDGRHDFTVKSMDFKSSYQERQRVLLRHVRCGGGVVVVTPMGIVTGDWRAFLVRLPCMPEATRDPGRSTA